MAGSPHRRSSRSILDAVVDRLVTVLWDRSKRISVLSVLAYVSGLAGVGLSVFGAGGDPTRTVTAVALALMGLSFVSMFVVSITYAHLDVRQ